MRRGVLKITKMGGDALYYIGNHPTISIYTNVHNLFDPSKFICGFLRDKSVFTIKVNLLLFLTSSYTTTNQTR